MNTFLEVAGSLVVKMPHFHCRGEGSFLGQGTKIPPVAQHDQKIEGKKSEYTLR